MVQIAPKQTLGFTFAAPQLSHPLTFAPVPFTSGTASLPTVTTTTFLKRPPPFSDAEHLRSRKKRRLRLHFSTSRLSRPYSNPASHAVDRGSCNIAVWAAQKRMQVIGPGGGRAALRKVAVLNSLRLRVLSQRGRRSPNFGPLDPERWGLKEEPGAGDEPEDGSTPAVTADGTGARLPSGEETPPDQSQDRHTAESDRAYSSATSSYSLTLRPPSPPGPSNYDALDDDDDYRGYAVPYSDNDEDEDDDTGYRPHPDWAVQPPPLPACSDDDDNEDEDEDDVSTSVGAGETPLPTPSPSPPTSHESVTRDQQKPQPVVSPNMVGSAAAAAAMWKQLDAQRPPSPPDESLLRLVRERMPTPLPVDAWSGFG